jgi:PBP1b-binding outer membrane lipoprotein LpoB
MKKGEITMKAIFIAITMIFLTAGCTENTKKEQSEKSQTQINGGSSMHFEPIPEDTGDEMPEF